METHMNFQLPPPPNNAGNLSWVEECILLCGEQVKFWEAQLQQYIRMRDDMTGSSAPGRAGSRSRPAPSANGGNIPEDIDLTALTVELHDAETNTERVLRVVEAAPPDKLLNTTQVGRVLHRSGATTKIQSLRVAAQRVFERNTAMFELVEGRPATYRRLGGIQGSGGQPGLGFDDPNNPD